MKQITVIGSLNMDFVLAVPKRPVKGESIIAKGMDLVPGGKGANQACTLGKLGAKTVMLGAVGQDTYGDRLIESLQQAGVETRWLMRTPEPTGMAMIQVDPQGDNSIVAVPGANAMVDRAYIDRCLPVLEESDLVIFQLEIPLDTVLYAAKKAKELGKTVILDPAPAPSVSIAELFPYVDLVKPNETELAALTGTSLSDPPEQAAALLKAQGVRDVVVTLGAQGALVLPEQGEPVLSPSVDAPVVDTTAAGDSFTAAMSIRLSEGDSLADAVRFANHVSSLVVAKKGAQSSIPTMDEVRTAFPFLF